MNPDQQTITKPIRLCGGPVSSEQLALIIQIVTHCGGLSRADLNAESGPMQGLVKDLKPVSLRRVSTERAPRLFREAIERHHYLGSWFPFGAHLYYLIEVARPTPTVVGVIQLSSPASPKRLLIYRLRADARESFRGDGGR